MMSISMGIAVRQSTLEGYRHIRKGGGDKIRPGTLPKY